MMGVQALEVVKSLLFVVLAGCNDGHAGWPFELGTGMAVMTPQESGNLWVLARIAGTSYIQSSNGTQRLDQWSSQWE